MSFEFSRISKANLTSVEYLKRHFLNHPACFFSNRPLIDKWTFCSRSWDKYPAHCTGLELFPELPHNKICYILHPKYTSFSCFPIICSSAIWMSLFYRNKSYLRHILYLEVSWLNVTPSFWRHILLRADYSLVYFMKVQVLMYPKRFMWYHVTFGYVAKM